VLAWRPPMRKNEYVDVHCPCVTSSLLKAGAEIPWWSSGGHAVWRGGSITD
jgi:hypothetical protein